MRIAWVVTLYYLISGLPVFGQHSFSERRFKVIYIEAFGNNVVQAQHASYGIWSLNYDTRFQKRRGDGWGLRFGFGMKTTEEYSRYYKSYYSPIILNKVTGRGRVALETGIGATLLMTYWFITDSRNGQLVQQHLFTKTVFGNVGIRLQPLNHGGFFRICWTPTIRANGMIDYKIMGISIGYGFR